MADAYNVFSRSLFFNLEMAEQYTPLVQQLVVKLFQRSPLRQMEHKPHHPGNLRRLCYQEVLKHHLPTRHNNKKWPRDCRVNRNAISMRTTTLINQTIMVRDLSVRKVKGSLPKNKYPQILIQVHLQAHLPEVTHYPGQNFHPGTLIQEYLQYSVQCAVTTATGVELVCTTTTAPPAMTTQKLHTCTGHLNLVL